MDLSGTGVWSGALRYGDHLEAKDSAAELEQLGYTACWVPDIGGDLFGDVGNLLGATRAMVVATGILNLWMHSPEEATSHYHDLVAVHGPRFLVGIGVSHAPLIDRQEAGTYRKPFARMTDYLDALDALDALDTPEAEPAETAEPAEPAETAETAEPAEPAGLPRSERVLAALGPRMLELARDRTRGAHPYLANPDHTRTAREILGSGPLLAPEQPVVLETDPGAAREVARIHLAGYLALPNYRNNLLRMGFSDDDVSAGGSDRLVDAIVVWGDEATIATRVQAHRDAGADHVCIQVLTKDGLTFPRDQWRRLASSLVTSRGAS